MRRETFIKYQRRILEHLLSRGKNTFDFYIKRYIEIILTNFVFRLVFDLHEALTLFLLDRVIKRGRK